MYRRGPFRFDLALPLVLVAQLTFVEILGLKDVKLEIEPNIVERNASTTFRCTYDLEGERLYAVKYYKGAHEFYRYTPNDSPSFKTFPVKDLHVAIRKTNRDQMVLLHVNFSLTGNYSCEVITDAPHFHVGVSTEKLLVVALPTDPPNLITDRSSYQIGDELRATCTSSSRPAAELTFILNNSEVNQTYRNETVQGELLKSSVYMVLPLSESHFHNGRLTLKCVAKLGHFYQNHTEITFDNTKDTIPVQPNRASTPGTTREDTPTTPIPANDLENLIEEFTELNRLVNVTELTRAVSDLNRELRKAKTNLTKFLTYNKFITKIDSYKF